MFNIKILLQRNKMKWMNQSHGLTLAVMAGIMASLGSVCAKLAMSREIVKSNCLPLGGNQFCEKVIIFLHNFL